MRCLLLYSYRRFLVPFVPLAVAETATKMHSHFRLENYREVTNYIICNFTVKDTYHEGEGGMLLRNAGITQNEPMFFLKLNLKSVFIRFTNKNSDWYSLYVV